MVVRKWVGATEGSVLNMILWCSAQARPKGARSGKWCINKSKNLKNNIIQIYTQTNLPYSYNLQKTCRCKNAVRTLGERSGEVQTTI